jgi:general secretion pathway protein E
VTKNPIDFSFAKKHRVLIESDNLDQGEITVIAHQPDLDTLLEIRRVIQKPFKIQLLDKTLFQIKLNQYYEKQNFQQQSIAQDMEGVMDLAHLFDEIPDTEDLLEAQEDAPVIKLINALLSEAIKLNASDIHFESFKNDFVIRFRIDGVLQEVVKPKKNLSALIVSRLKVMAKLDIAEKKLPQDGRMGLKIAGRLIDVRVSVLPSNHGERVVLRILDQKNAKLELSELISRKDIQDKLIHLIEKTHGILLVTGPTGSGKTTTLYAAINYLNDVKRNILTVEDPIEYDITGIGQTQINPKVGMTFAKGLRAILRQDPDVIMVGEIRDKETADIAIESSLTGHMVLSTLHTNTALGAITRMQDMGVQPFLLASSLNGVIAQRLIRKLCMHCKQSIRVSSVQVERYPILSQAETLFQAKGCDECNQLGYRGRLGIYEMVEIDEPLKEMIHALSGEQVMQNYIKNKTDDLLTDGLKQVILGETTLEEVLRVVQGVKT